MAPAFWQLSFIIFPAIAILHLHVSPYTKVEESFNVQAIHDILEYGVPISDAAVKFKHYYDHMTFPGAVPRSFIGSLIVAGLAKPEVWLGDLIGKASQTHARAVLGGMNATALAIFSRSIERAYGPIAATWYVVLQASQFHIWYYASRTLPNMFAFFLSTLALAFLLPNPTSTLGPVKRTRLGLYLMTIATVIFRSELALLLGAHCVWLLLKPQTLNAKVALFRTTFLPAIIPGALIGLLLTVTIDSYFWQSSTPLWPELSAFLSNIFPSASSKGASDWGTQPFYWYLVVALPRLLMNQLPMIDLFFIYPSTLGDLRVLDNLIPSYAYLVLYSILPHKETRFLFPIVPSLTLVAALTCTRLTINAHKSTTQKLLLYAAIVSTIITAFISHAILLPLSAQNYPGGQALEILHEYYHNNHEGHVSAHNKIPSQPEIHVHLTNLALQSGVTRFLEQPHLSSNLTDETIPPAISIHETRENDNSNLDSIILPGDLNHPALTIRPKTPSPSVIPGSADRKFSNPTWIYDKSANDTLFLQPTFWSQFDFVIVEDPSLAIGAWEIITEVQSLGKPHLSRPSDSQNARYKLWQDWKTPDELWIYWTTPDASDLETGTTALLHAIYPSSIATPLSRLHDIAHDILRLGHYLPIQSLTGGYWLDIPLQTRLYILQQTQSGTAPNPPINSKSNPKQNLNHQASHTPSTSHNPTNPKTHKTHPNQHNTEDKYHANEDTDTETEFPTLPQEGSTHQIPIAMDLDQLGPLVVNKDGTLSRIDNWSQMTKQEKKKTVEYLRKRNMLRMDGIEAVVE